MKELEQAILDYFTEKYKE
jgi:hypothetical protein